MQRWPIKEQILKPPCLFSVFLRWFPCHGDWFPLRRDSQAHGSRNQTPAFVLFEPLQVDKRTDEGGGGGVGEWGCIEEERQVRHRSLVSAIWSRCRQGDKRKKQQREEGSAAGKVICLRIEDFSDQSCSDSH